MALIISFVQVVYAHSIIFEVVRCEGKTWQIYEIIIGSADDFLMAHVHILPQEWCTMKVSIAFNILLITYCQPYL